MVDGSALEVVVVDGIFFEDVFFLIVDVDKVIAFTVVDSGVSHGILQLSLSLAGVVSTRW